MGIGGGVDPDRGEGTAPSNGWITRPGEGTAGSHGRYPYDMHATAPLQDAAVDSSWRVSRDGTVVAVVDVRHEGGEVIVATAVDGVSPHHFDTLQAASAFIEDLMTSFAFLGCDVART